MNRTVTRRILWGLVAAMLGLASSTTTALERTSPSTADHERFKALQGPFASGPKVTEACLKCHTEAADQLQASIHWTWEYLHPETRQLLGKRHVVNSFCGSVASNEPFCTSCHTGYGWKDMREAPPVAGNRVDCLVCHDTTGDYWKSPTGAGHPVYDMLDLGDSSSRRPPDLAQIARNIGPTNKQNCGSCHFYGGGGDGVKHGDLDSSLIDPSFSLDVHMSPEGADFACADCHTTSAHSVSGSRYLAKARDTQGIDVPGHTDFTRASCESCHGVEPHGSAKLNDHVDQVACQSCHIPEFARGGVATKTWWDWSTAGRLGEDGKPLTIRDDDGNLEYLSTKGSFRHGENVAPEYRWFDGQVRYTLRSDTLDDSRQPIEINKLQGSHDDPNSRIWPFKIMQGKQPYDPVNQHLLVNHVYSANNDTALWTNFDWTKALKAGTEYADQPYSGEFAFVETLMHWPITHMVAPAKDALRCSACHAREGRLAALTDFYLPARDRSIWLDRAGWSAALLVLVGSLAHAGGRILTRRRRKRS
ncbi:tetrathionate reductase family octaheme c-type cytochrome [Pistricoccus aurantiacus]|uniref:Tetrathionate reductase family octaheme c-type cytochrome n=1 Tax=Pistricoccus aurantiacus TaxID=1883414 RepID=A0A5B8SWW1_9GAMM|nr:tetrathionate reductase family octaheme c-type cytochrome [Pistricoccus aurantiacus]QEA40594.1 tetrathionate reductase family octaheme c-type cytochrome [Pistricoccus aurantiacus]